MNETLTDPLSDYGAVALFLTFAGTLMGLLRAFITHRTRLRMERAASARVRFVARDREVILHGHDLTIEVVRLGDDRGEAA